MDLDQPGGFLEYKQRLVFSLYRAACRVGIRLGMPLEQMERLLRMAYLREAREEQGLDLKSVASIFGKSLRTVSTLHQRYQSDFFSPEEQVQLRRDIAGVVNARARTLDELVPVFPGVQRASLLVAIDDLVREGRLRRDGDVLRRNPLDHDFYDPSDASRRVDGLNRQMDILAATVWQRLVENDDAPIARSYVFDANDDDYERLVRELLAKIRDDAIAADAAAQDADARVRRGITLAAVDMEPPE